MVRGDAVNGSMLGHFKITAKLGEGGMGVVYRAEDTTLGREVAIKVLQPSVASDTDRLARLGREAKALAALNHANIAAIFSIDSARPDTGADSETPGENPVTFLVMELVDGEDLNEIIDRGPLPVDQVLEIAAQLAEALEAAHDRGIIHRDLKPANIKVADRNRVKVLDFGLAKALMTPGDHQSAAQDPSAVRTMTADLTTAGSILGTPAYMAPEQILGEPADKRADIWAYGVTVVEMLTGKKVFSGSSSASVKAKILEGQPDWEQLTSSTPAPLIEVLKRCIERDPYRRLRDIGEARFAVRSILARGIDEEADDDRRRPPPTRAGFGLLWILGGLTLILAGALAWTTARPANPSPEPVRFSIRLPAGAHYHPSERSALSVSRDGSKLVYVGGDGEATRLYTRRLNATEISPIDHTRGARSPLFSLDGKWIYFYVDGTFKRIPIDGGPPQTIGGGSPVTRGQSWRTEDVLIFTPTKASGLWQAFLPDGGYHEVAGIEDGGESSGLCWPDVLPGGNQALVSRLNSTATSWDDGRLLLVDLESGEKHRLIEGGSQPTYLPTGHIVFAVGGALMAVPFDRKTGSLTGTPVTVVDDVLCDPASGVAHYAVSDTGTLVYAREGAAPRTCAGSSGSTGKVGPRSSAGSHVSFDTRGSHPTAARSPQPSPAPATTSGPWTSTDECSGE